MEDEWGQPNEELMEKIEKLVKERDGIEEQIWKLMDGHERYVAWEQCGCDFRDRGDTIFKRHDGNLFTEFWQFCIRCGGYIEYE